MSAMPICRHSAPRAANDNRRSRLAPVWPWAMAAAAAPAVTAALILTRLI
jgi:hypothetical protein